MKNDIKMFERNSIEILYAKGLCSLPLHSHECFCFGVVLDGEATFLIDDKRKELRKGMTYLIPSNVGVTIDTDAGTYGYSYITICLKNELKDNLMIYQYDNFFPHDDKADEIMHICDRFIGGGSQRKFLEDVTELILDGAGEAANSDSEDDYEKKLVTEASDYIKSHLLEKFDLDAAADSVHISKYHFIRLFKKYMGVTPNQYYIQAKLFLAKIELKGEHKESDVAADLGFSDQSYLCNTFKKHMGISMKDFRNNISSF